VAGRVLRGLYVGLTKDEALRLPDPQDAIFRLHGGRIERLDCAALPSPVPGV
jgi:probable phosphoglycerate mutase